MPAALIFEGRFSNNSTTQYAPHAPNPAPSSPTTCIPNPLLRRLQLLNSTVAQLAKSVNQVLTTTYNTLYGDEDDESEEPAQLRLQTAPLSATQELASLFSVGIIDQESALPAALNSLGASADEVTAAQERAKRLREEQAAQAAQEMRAAQPTSSAQSSSKPSSQTKQD